MTLQRRKARGKPQQQAPAKAVDQNDASGDDASEDDALEDDESPVVETERKQMRGSILSRRRFLFPLGVFVGTIIGLLAIPSVTDPLSIPAQLAVLLSEPDWTTNFSSVAQRLSSAVPTWDWEFDWPQWGRLEIEWESLKARIPEPWKLNNDGREFRVGERMREEGRKANFPVVLIPGIISTGLESWSTTPEYRSWFREKLWGGFSMISQVTFSKDKWIAALMLDPYTGLDPPGVRVRAAQGIDAASSFIQGYWIWSKIVENLAVVGYDTNNLLLASYDWRLSFYNLEVRDGYYSRMKASIEDMRRRHGKRVVLVAHSMGSAVTMYFLKWVEAPDHGGGGSSWVENHIEAVISVAGTHLGVPKALTAFLSGEMKDTVELNPTGAYVLERFFSRKERAKLFRSWAGSASMWIKGGNAIWGNHTHAPDDLSNCTESHGSFLSFRPSELVPQKESHREAQNGNELDHTMPSDVKNMTADEAGTWILQHTPDSFQRMMATNYSCGIERDETILKQNNDVPSKWSNPLESRLPVAPSMKLFCVYGHGKETERAYWYARGEYEHDETHADAAGAVCANSTECSSPQAPLGLPLSRKSWIDVEVTNETPFPKVRNGVKFGEGDGTVSLLSLGAMCVEGWKRKRWNPGGIKVVTTELPHLPTLTVPRGGANTSDHVDILGSTGLNELILKVATGGADEIEDTFVSNIREYAARMQWD